MSFKHRETHKRYHKNIETLLATSVNTSLTLKIIYLSKSYILWTSPYQFV